MKKLGQPFQVLMLRMLNHQRKLSWLLLPDGSFFIIFISSIFILPHLNTGTCVDQINGYKCQCQPGYTGIDCDVDIDECQSFPCINGKVRVIRVEKSNPN